MMIFFVWSLVLSAVNYARRQKMSAILARHFASRFHRHSIVSFKRLNPRFPGLVRMASEPILGTDTILLYKTEYFQVSAKTSQGCLNPLDWCLANSSLHSIEDSKIVFVACVREEPFLQDREGVEPLQISSVARALAWRKGKPWEILFACELEDFFAIACAWADRLLRHAQTGDVKELLTVHLNDNFFNRSELNPSESVLLSPTSSPDSRQPLTLLEQLYLNDISAVTGTSKQHLRRSDLGLNRPYDTFESARIDLSSGAQSPIDSIPAYIKNLEQRVRLERQSALDKESILDKVRSAPASSIPSECSPISSIGRTPEHSAVRILVEIEDNPGDIESTASVEKRSASVSELPQKIANESLSLSKCSLPDHHHHQRSCRSSMDALYVDTDPAPPPRLMKLKQRRLSASIEPPTQPIDTRRHSSLMPRDLLLGRERRRSLSPLALSSLQEHPPALLTRSAFAADSFRRQSNAPIRRKFSCNSQGGAPVRPPSILIFTGENQQLFERIADSLRGILPAETHAVFRISLKAIREHPWIDIQAVCLLIGETESLDDRAWLKLQEYFKQGGKMMFVCQNSLLSSLTSSDSTKKRTSALKMAFGDKQMAATLGKDFEQFLKKVVKALKKGEVNETFHSKDLAGGSRYSVVASKSAATPLLLYMQNQPLLSSALFSDATIDLLLADGCKLIGEALQQLGVTTVDSPRPPAIAKLSLAYLIQSPDSPRNLDLPYDANVGAHPTLRFVCGAGGGDLAATQDFLPVIVDPNDHFPYFDETKYYDNLSSEIVGRVVLFVPTCNTTMDIAKSVSKAMPEENSIVVIARYQLRGKGRGGNQWLSPAGCAMFSFNYNLDLGSKLGRNAGFIQHLLALSVVDGICSLPDMTEFPLSLKWPNDIYYGRQYKLGGVLVDCSVTGSRLDCVLGCGLNVSNSYPTVCINDMIPQDMNSVSVEQVIAVTLSTFEGLVKLFQINGPEEFLPLYYDYWLHAREEVTLEDRKETVIIRGLDAYGYLEVRSRKTGKVFSVHPDGNTFDMMKNLIRVKYD